METYSCVIVIREKVLFVRSSAVIVILLKCRFPSNASYSRVRVRCDDRFSRKRIDQPKCSNKTCLVFLISSGGLADNRVFAAPVKRYVMVQSGGSVYYHNEMVSMNVTGYCVRMLNNCAFMCVCAILIMLFSNYLFQFVVMCRRSGFFKCFPAAKWTLARPVGRVVSNFGTTSAVPEVTGDLPLGCRWS